MLSWKWSLDSAILIFVRKIVFPRKCRGGILSWEKGKECCSNWQGQEQIMYVSLAQFQRIIFFYKGNGEIFFSDQLSKFHDSITKLSDATLWRCLQFNCILSKSKQLNFSVQTVIRKGIIFSFDLVFLAFSYFC